MKSTLFFILFIFTASFLQAQEHPEIQLKKGFMGLNHYVGGQKTNKAHFLRILKTDPDSYNIYKKGKKIQTSANIIGTIGLIFTISGSILLVDGNLGAAIPIGISGTGIGALVTAAIIEGKSTNQKKLAVEEYNIRRGFSLNVRGTSNGVGFVLLF